MWKEGVKLISPRAGKENNGDESNCKSGKGFSTAGVHLGLKTLMLCDQNFKTDSQISDTA